MTSPSILPRWEAVISSDGSFSGRAGAPEAVGHGQPLPAGSQLEHLEDALPGEQLALSEAEISRFEEPYVPRAIVWHA